MIEADYGVLVMAVMMCLGGMIGIAVGIVLAWVQAWTEMRQRSGHTIRRSELIVEG